MEGQALQLALAWAKKLHVEGSISQGSFLQPRANAGRIYHRAGRHNARKALTPPLHACSQKIPASYVSETKGVSPAARGVEAHAAGETGHDTLDNCSAN